MFFSFFQNLNFLGPGQRAKSGPEWQKNLSVSLYLRNRTSYNCDFWYTCVKWYLQQILSFFKILIFGVFRGIKGKKWPKMTNFSLFCSRSYWDFDNDIGRCFSLFFFKSTIIVNIKIICFLLAHFSSFLNNCLFFKFMNKCQKEILTCAPPFSHVCDIL